MRVRRGLIAGWVGVLAYAALLGAVVLALGTSLALRKPFKVDVVRDRGALARLVADGRIENVYRLQVMNATESLQRYRVRVEGLAGAAVASKPEFEVGPTQSRWVPVGVQLAPEAARTLGAGAHALRFEVERLDPKDAGRVEVVEKSTFMVPR
jgi:polyferredoxin